MNWLHDVLLILITGVVLGIWVEVKRLNEEYDDEM